MHTVICGPTAWPASATADILGWFRDFIPAQDEDLYGFFAAMTVPPVAPFPEAFHLQKACAVVWCYSGDPARADEAFAPVRRMEPAFDGIGPAPYPALQSTFDGLYPKGLQWYWRGDFFRRYPMVRSKPTPASPRNCRRCTPRCTSIRSTARCNGSGKPTPRGPTGTSTSHRSSRESIQTRPTGDVEAVGGGLLGRDPPALGGGAYVNFMMDEGQDRIQATYGPNYQRLSEVKAQYDPTNVFRINQNITPAGSHGS